MGAVPAGGPGFNPYRLKLVARFKFEEIQVVVALFPCKNEYGYQVPFGDWYSIVIWKPGLSMRTGF